MEKGSGGEGGGCKGRRHHGVSRTHFWKACVCVCMCVWWRGEVLSKPSGGFSAVQLGAASSLVGFPPDGDGRVLVLSVPWWSTHRAPCWLAGIFSSPTALLWSFPHTSAMAPDLKKKKSSKIHFHLIWRRWSMGVDGSCLCCTLCVLCRRRVSMGTGGGQIL